LSHRAGSVTIFAFIDFGAWPTRWGVYYEPLPVGLWPSGFTRQYSEDLTMICRADVRLETLEPRRLLATIAINTADAWQTIDSMGGNYAQGYLQGDAQDTVGTITLSTLDPKYVRVGIPSKDWEIVNDNADPAAYAMSSFNEVGYITDVFKLIKSFKDAGRIVTASAFNLPDWMVSNPFDRDHRKIIPGLEGEAAEHIAAFVKRAWEGYGAKIDFLSFNESNGGYRVQLSASEQADLIEAIGNRLKADGINIKFLVGDTYRLVKSTAYIKSILDDPGAQPFLGPLSFHSWWSTSIAPNEWLTWREIADAYGKDLWNAEMNWNAKIESWAFPTWSNNAIEVANIVQKTLGWAHADAALYWQYQHDYELMNSSGSDKYYAYYVVKSYVDHLKPGSQIVSAESNDAALLPLAGRDIARNHFMTNVVNTAATEKSATFTGLPNAPLTWVINAADQKNITMGTYTPVNGVLTLALPASSVSTLFGDLGTVGAPPAAVSSDLPAGWRSVDVGTLDVPGSATEVGGAYALRGSGVDIGTGTYDKFHYAYNWMNGDGQMVARVTGFDATDPGAKVGVMIRDGISGYDRMAALVLTPANGLQSALRTEEGVTGALSTLTAGSFATLPKWLKLVRSGDTIEFNTSTNGTAWTKVGQATLKLGKKVTVGLAVTSHLAGADATGRCDGVQGGPVTQSVALRAGNDAYVRGGSYAAINYGSSTSLLSRADASSSNVRESYLRFDLGGVGAIGSAKLRVYGRLNDGANPSVAVGVYTSSNTSWSESTITWSNRPGRSTTALDQETVIGTTSQWYEWDVTAYLKAQKTAGATAVTLVLANPFNSSSRGVFQSDEASNSRPELVIDAASQLPPPPPPPGDDLVVRPAADTVVRSGSYAASNYGTSTWLYVQQSSYPNNSRESYLRFDLSGMSSSAASVKLRLFGRIYEGSDPNLPVAVYSATDVAWGETAVTWNTRPAHGAAPLASVNVSGTTDQWYEWDVTSYVLAQKAAGATAVTFVLASTVTKETRARFSSDEAASKGPVMVVA
jgi:predicted RecA/RadA family phage recombinase